MSAKILPLHVILFSRAPIDLRYHEVFSHACGLDAHFRLEIIFAETPEEVLAKITAEAFDGVFLTAVIDFCSGRFRSLPLFGMAELEEKKDRLARDYPALRSVLSVDAFLSREFRSLFMSYIADKNTIPSLAAQQENLLSLIQHSVNGMLVFDKQNSKQEIFACLWWPKQLSRYAREFLTLLRGMVARNL